MGVPIVYRKSGETSIASYDFIDAMQGVGFVTFYAVYDGTNYDLSRETLDSQKQRISYATDSSTFQLGWDLDWDLDFNLPQVVGGAPVFVNATIDIQPAITAYEELDVYVYKVDGSGVETLLGSASGAIVSGTVEASARLLTQVTIPKTKIKGGEKLRVNTKMYVRTTVGGSLTWNLWCDGGARGTSSGFQLNPAGTGVESFKNLTNLVVSIPFKLDI